jgi:sulfate transport system permease protein
MGWLSLIVLLPLAALLIRSTEEGLGAFISSITEPEALAAIRLTVISALVITLINAVIGTLIAWVLVRDEFPGKRFVNSLIDLPFALPTIVAGLLLLTLYGEDSPIGISVAYTVAAVGLALLFVTLPFVVRAVQPVLSELDTEMEEAAASLGASRPRIFFSVILPNLTPAIVAGCALAFAKAIGEFGSLVLITGNIPFDTQVASVYIFGRIESDNTTAAAAVSVFLLVISIAILFSINLISRWRSRHDEV